VLDKAGVAHETIEVPGSLEIADGHRHRAPVVEFRRLRRARLRDPGGDVPLRRGGERKRAGADDAGPLQGVCIGNGIITVENREQAEERADGARLNTAGGAAEAALHLIALTRRLGKPKGGIGFKARPDVIEIAGDPKA
jgi:6,7-dimethyl-8-ribityllumazine synthase